MSGPRLVTEEERGRQSGLTVEQLSTIQLFDTAVLSAVAAGKLDLNRLAREELANRGLNPKGRWVGFPEARRLAGLHPYEGVVLPPPDKSP
jgi:hypothetical protein